MYDFLEFRQIEQRHQMRIESRSIFGEYESLIDGIPQLDQGSLIVADGCVNG
jgi:hypothetical protein